MGKWFGIANRLKWALLAAIAILAVTAFAAYRRLPGQPAGGGRASAHLEWPQAGGDGEVGQWNIFRAGDGGADLPPSGPISSSYRLAGTFLQYGDFGGEFKRPRMAILDDLERERQTLVAEGDVYRDVEVVRISKEYVLLQKDGNREELWLSFQSAGSGSQGKEEAQAVPPPAESGQKVLGTSRFGKQVGKTRWVFEKDALRDFYSEMLDNPERAVDIYETMRPHRDSDNDIRGYTVDIVGEEGFFDAVGLQNGDVVRKVNSMEMSSRGRAEYFMKEFMKDRIDAVVLDIERDDEQKKLIYLLR